MDQVQTELEEQLEKIDTSLRQQVAQVNTTESAFQEAAGKRRELRKKLEECRGRCEEVAALVVRFNLLDRHYASDIERLRAIEEGGTLLTSLVRRTALSAAQHQNTTGPRPTATAISTP